MYLNKEIIPRFVVAFIFIGVSLGIVVPIILNLIKGKYLGLRKKNFDFDYMVKQQKELLKSQYSIKSSDISATSSVAQKTELRSNVIKEIKKEISWGGNELAAELRQIINKDFSYQFSTSKMNAFILLVEKRNYLRLLDSVDDKIDKDSLMNFLASLFILLVLIDENREKITNFTEKCAKKLNIPSIELQIAIQLKVLMSNKENNIKEERIFVEQLILQQYSEDTIQKSVHAILINETNIWKKSISSFFDELSIFLTYAEFLSPLKRPENNKDLLGALAVFNENEKYIFDEIKKKYKKLVQIYHPDKIMPQKLPKSLEKKALLKFNIIQESFEIISSRKA